METSHAETTTATTTKAKPKTKRRQRSRPLPPDVTSRNLAIEKRRREDMNVIFSDLTGCLPRLASAKRVSKRLIVVESLQQLRRQRGLCVAAAAELRELLAAHNGLVAEANALRAQLGVPGRNAPRPPSAALLSLVRVEDEERAYGGGRPDGFASPSTTEEYEPQLPSSGQGGLFTPLAGPLVTPDLGPPGQAPAQVNLLDCLDGTRNLALPGGWQAQTSGPLYSSSNVQEALVPDMDWWGLDMTGPNAEFPWEDLPAHVLP